MKLVLVVVLLCLALTAHGAKTKTVTQVEDVIKRLGKKNPGGTIIVEEQTIEGDEDGNPFSQEEPLLTVADIDNIPLIQGGDDRGLSRIENKDSHSANYLDKLRTKSDILEVSPGMMMTDGTQIKGIFKSLKSCMTMIELFPSCMAGDYDEASLSCYCHDYHSVCPYNLQFNRRGYDPVSSFQKGVTNFRKIPCHPPANVIAQTGSFRWIRPGRQGTSGTAKEMFGINHFADCLKTCMQAGGGVTSSAGGQICYGLNFDFAVHKCYFFTDNICDTDPPDITEFGFRRIRPPTVLIALCMQT